MSLTSLTYLRFKEYRLDKITRHCLIAGVELLKLGMCHVKYVDRNGSVMKKIFLVVFIVFLASSFNVYALRRPIIEKMIEQHGARFVIDCICDVGELDDTTHFYKNGYFKFKNRHYELINKETIYRDLSRINMPQEILPDILKSYAKNKKKDAIIQHFLDTRELKNISNDDVRTVHQQKWNYTDKNLRQNFIKHSPNEIQLPWFDPKKIRIGQTIVVSKKTPLMPTIDIKSSKNLFEELKKVKRIPPRGAFYINKIQKKGNNDWYQAMAFDTNLEYIGVGWINSGALMGQKIKIKQP